jgi:hypothetical protein
MICKKCLYYEPDYGTWGVFGWSKDGSKGYCCVEPKRVFVDGNRIKCRYFLSKTESEVKHDKITTTLHSQKRDD